MEKKKLDELFQEKFLDFKEVPSNSVWQSIEASLDKKKKKRILPIWWTAGSIAAALLISFLVFNPFKKDNYTNEIIVDTQQDTLQQPTIHSNPSIENSSKNKNSNTNRLVTSDAEQEASSSLNNAITKTGTKVKELENPKKEDTSHSHVTQPNILKQAKTTTIALSTSRTQNNSPETALPLSLQEKKLAQAIANTDKNKKTNTVNSENNVVLKNENTGLTVLSPQQEESNNIETVLNETSVANTATKNLEDVANPSNKKSIFDAITDDKEVAETTKINRWSAGPSIAPVYSNSIGEGSPINSIFTSNSKSGNINMSYGLTVAYQVSNKLKVRSGIHKVNYGYDTNDISFTSSFAVSSSQGQLNTVNYNPNSKNLAITSDVAVQNFAAKPITKAEFNSKSIPRKGFMSQQLAYLEIPLEINYALLDSKLGIDVVGGFSSLILTDNNIALTSGELTTAIGEANNINKLNFSANMGLGFHYNFGSKTRLNVEPVFKYQLNTFSQVNGNFNPYSIGIYSGITYKF